MIYLVWKSNDDFIFMSDKTYYKRKFIIFNTRTITIRYTIYIYYTYAINSNLEIVFIFAG